MATLFMEPGGDADFAVNHQTTTPPGFWDSTLTQGAAVATDFVHGGHKKSIKYRPANSGDSVNIPPGGMGAAGGRISFYIYLVSLPAADNFIGTILTSAISSLVRVTLRTTGALQLNKAGGAQMGSDSSTLITTGRWYRISIAYTWTSQSVNAWRLYIDGVLAITSGSVALVSGSAPGSFWLGNLVADSTLDMRSSDHYTDDNTSLTDTGNVYVVAKRPIANGTANGFTTQIGSGGSGVGSGHSPQVNERPASETNGWAIVGAGSVITEEYNIEGQSAGDIDISSSTILDIMGWVMAKSLASETASIILNNVASNISLTSTDTIFKKFAGSTSYPAGTGTDIGIKTTTALTTVSLYEAGVLVAVQYVAAPKTAVLSETTTSTDTISKSPMRSLLETITDTDTILKIGNKILKEIITDTDTLLKQGIKILKETITDTDTFAKVRTTFGIFTETITNTATMLRTMTHVMTETLSMVATSLQQAMRTFLETITDTDTFAGSRVHPVSLSEVISMVDLGITRVMTFVYTETLSMVDTLNKLSNRLFTEATSLTATFTSARTTFGLFLETISTTDVLTYLEQRILSETIATTATFTGLRLKSANFTETVTDTDSILRTMTRTFAEILSMLDILARGITKVAFTETLSMIATCLKLGQRIFTETITDTDSILEVQQRFLTETFHLFDQVVVRLNGIVTNLWAKVARTLDSWTKSARDTDSGSDWTKKDII